MKELIEALTGELEDIKLFLECEEHTNRLMYKSVCEKLEMCWEALTKAKEEEKPKSKKDLICEAIQKGKGVDRIKELRDKDYDKQSHIETIYSRIQTELAKYENNVGEANEIDAIKVAAHKVFSESVKPVLIELDKQYQLKDKYINCIEDLSDEITQLHKEQPKNEQGNNTAKLNAEEFLKSKGIEHDYINHVDTKHGPVMISLVGLLEEYASSKLPSEEEIREEVKQEVREWLINEDFEGLAERI